MIVDTNAYVLSLIQVYVCCLIRDFLIPLLAWKNHLKSKSYGYRFWFCVLTQAAFQINLVLLLSFFNICNSYLFISINCVYYLLVTWNYSDKKFFQLCRKNASRLWYAYKEDRLSKYIVSETVGLLQDYYKRFRYLPVWNFIRRNYIEVLLLGILAAYNIWFLTHNVMLYHCYQFSDIPVHQSWIYELEHGTVFSDGIYPFGMHIMIYMIRILFRLNLREIMLYAGTYQTILLMIGLYLLAKEIFYAKYTPIAALVIISFMLNQSRYAASLPQEVGMYAVIGLAYFMLRYLRQDRKKIIIEGDSGLSRVFRINAYINRRYLGSEAILLMLCVALVIAYHFYTAIAAIFLVISIGLAYLPRILKKQYFIPLMYCGIMGAIIAALPFGAYLAKGIPFQESMAWATSVTAGEEWKGRDTDYQSALAKAQGWDDKEDSTIDPIITGENEEEKGVDYSGMTPGEIYRHYYYAIFNFGVLAMFGREATQLMFDCMKIGLCCALIMLLFKKTRIYGQAYTAFIIYMIILFTVGAAEPLGLIELIAAARASTFAEPFTGLIYMLPVDFAFRILGIWKWRTFQSFLKLLSAAVCAAVAVVILDFGWYHTFFDVNQAYYNEAEYLLRHIKKSYDINTYTIVSPTEEYYDVIDYGYHTEISEFMNMINGKQKKFTFPTKYVFFFVEKKVMQDYFYGSVEVSLKYAAKDFSYLANSQDYYFQRAIIESQAYYWARKIEQIYPRSFKVYYEDDIYVAYILKQNVFNPYDLRIDYLDDYRKVIEVNGWNGEE